MTRTDIHRPSAMNPADYTAIGEADAHHEQGYLFFDWETYAGLGEEQASTAARADIDGVKWANPKHQSGMAGCDHCGQTNIRYWTFFLHTPTGEILAVGQQCAAKLGLADRGQLELRQRGEAERVRGVKATWLAADDRHRMADLIITEAIDGGRENDFIHSLASQLRRKGELSTAQVDAVIRGAEKFAAMQAARAEREAAMPAAAPVPLTDERITIKGQLIGCKEKESDYGIVTKMTVVDDRGFKLWGTMPGPIMEVVFRDLAAQSEKDVQDAINTGRKILVQFDCKVSRSDNDATFGFINRPTKGQAKVLPA